MDIAVLLNDKALKSKDKTALLSKFITDDPKHLKTLIDYATTAKDPQKATCIEAIEYATKAIPELATKSVLLFVTGNLTSKTPRVKWESARVIGNIAHLFPKDLGHSIVHLLENTEHSGTVVRWSAAFALSEIVKLKTKHNGSLIPAIEAIIESEEQNSIKKIYLSALKKCN